MQSTRRFEVENNMTVNSLSKTYCTIFNQVSDAEDETSFNTAIQTDTVLDCLEIVGFNGVPRFQTKDAIVKDVCQFYIIDRVRSAIEDFKAGLQTLGILNLIEKHPNTMAQVFCSNSLLKLTASRMDSLFVPELAEEGANVRPQQELIIMHWRDYLQDCEGEVLHDLSVILLAPIYLYSLLVPLLFLSIFTLIFSKVKRNYLKC